MLLWLQGYDVSVPIWVTLLNLADQWSTPPWEIEPDVPYTRLQWIAMRNTFLRLKKFVADEESPDG